MSLDPNYWMHLEVDGCDPDAFGVHAWTCAEGLSQLTQMSVLVHGPDSIKPDSLLRKNARLKVMWQTSDNKTHAITEIPAMVTGVMLEIADAAPGRCAWRFTLKSRLYLTTLTQASRVFLDKSVKEIIQEVLEGDGFVIKDDFEFKLKETYEPYEYTVQYQETDFDFISRLMEDEGIYYYISDRYLGADKKAELKDYLVILDNLEFHPERSKDADQLGGAVPYRPVNPTNPGGWAIGSFSMEYKILPKEVLLKDYNYRKPGVEMKGMAPAAKQGFGTYYSYGDHFKTPDEGTTLAEIRAEEITCRVSTWWGTSAVHDLEPALNFEVIDHPISDWNGRYIITSINHNGYQPGASDKPGDEAKKATYSNSFTAIRAETQWRPERSTPKPKIYGFLHATVDAAASGEYAEIDDMGRYKVKLPFDVSDAKDGKASRFIRMMQSYTGSEYGMHFPLHKGAEVLLAHLDGDPDRPIILGGVPNPDTTSPITGKNQSKSAIHTAGGNRIYIEDTNGSQQIHIYSPTSGTMITMGAPGT